MSVRVSTLSARYLFAAVLLLSTPPGALGRTQTRNFPAPATQTDAGDDVRGTVKAKEFVASRPGKGSPHPGSYRSRQRLPRGRTYATVGVTIGRGRRATESERKDYTVAKVQAGDGEAYVLERISDAAVTDGTLMQMIIEYLSHGDAAAGRSSARVGYLYVINREQYPDGTYSPPRLIFPTGRTYGGDGRVMPGKTVTLPVPDRVWKVSRSTSAVAQAFETYTIIVSPKPLKDSSGRELQGDSLGDAALVLDEKLVARWARMWGGGWRGDLMDGEGQLITRREQTASGDPNRGHRSTGEEGSDLTKDDAPPQIVFRRLSRPGDAMLVTIRLLFKDASATTPPKPQP